MPSDYSSGYPDEKSNNPFIPGSAIVTGGSYAPENPDAASARDFAHLSPFNTPSADGRGSASLNSYMPPQGPPPGAGYNSSSDLPPAYDNSANANREDPDSNGRPSQSNRDISQSLGGQAGSSSQQPSGYQSGSYGNPPPQDQPSTSDPRGFLSMGGSQNSQQAHPSFSRLPPSNLPYNAFPPAYLIANGKRLDAGFTVMPPPSPIQPHPFTTHDVNEGDWNKFHGELQRSAAMAAAHEQQQHQSNSMGGMGGMGGRRRGLGGGLIGGLLIPAVVGLMKSDKPKGEGKTVSQVVDMWNHYFFHPRRIELVLAQGRLRIDNGPGPVPNLDPYREQSAPHSQRRSRSLSSSSSSSDSDRGHDRGDKRTRRLERRARKAHRRAERLEGRAERRMGGRRGFGQSEFDSHSSHDGHGKGRSGEDKLFRLFIIAI